VNVSDLEGATLNSLEDEVLALRDVARRAAILVRWHSQADHPYTELTAEDRLAMDRDAEALEAALRRAGHHAEGWGR